MKTTLTSQNRTRLLGARARLLDLTTDAILVRDPSDRITFWNKGASEMYGFTREEAAGRVSHDLLRTEFPEPLQLIKEQFARDGYWAGELQHTRANGSGITVSTRWAAEYDVRGNIASILESNRDISESKRAQEAQARLAAIVESSEDAIVSKGLDGIIINWNKAAERIFGYGAEEAIGQHITLIVPPDRLDEEAHILASLRRGERVDHFETVRKRKDGSLLDISATISPVKDAVGRVIGASKVARDVTAQKQAERALRESEQRFRVITDASPILVWMSGTDKLCYYFNKGWLDFVGRTLEQESGNGWTENVYPEDFDRCLQMYVSNFDARRSFEMEYRMRHRTGQYRWILDRGVPRYAPDGTFEGYVGACFDIHEQKEAAEKVRIADDMARLMKAQDEERRRIARELHDSAGQTLAVLGMSLAQMVQRAEGIAPELAKQGKEIEAIVRQLAREIRTTSYLLHPPLLDETGLGSALKWYVDGLSERSDVAITLDVSDNIGRLPSDMELAIFRFVQECLTNIHRHSGSKTAHIRVAREEKSVRAEVQDHGKGMSPERLLEIQSHCSGVGTRGIRERMRQFHGEMKIESGGSGTCVIVLIPIPKEASSADNDPLQAAV
ncbi:MAG TPA: PAS domain S-box protein [Terriglobales bacterium]|nr:PAS domain S-box protein [Terriglobales bacterium]